MMTLSSESKHFDLKVEEEWVETEVLWSPDSTAFSLTGNPNGYTNETHIFRVTPSGPQLVDLSAMQRTFAASYPPCVGLPERDTFCDSLKYGRGYNYATFAWSAPHTAVIIAEVTPTGRYGKNLGQVAGYEIDASTGLTTRTMTAIELKKRWQSRMAWNLKIPDPVVD